MKHWANATAVLQDFVKLFVGYVALDVHDNELHALFSQYGHVHECQVIRERDTGTSRGFAFVAMGSEAEANQCIASLDGFNIGGKRLVVRMKVRRT